jgi:hypothetical protein
VHLIAARFRLSTFHVLQAIAVTMSSRAKKAKRTATPAAAAAAAARSLQPVYAIKCSRESVIDEYDEESYTDCWGPEIDDHTEDIDSSATSGDGEWMFDSGSKFQHRTDHATAGLRRSAGTLRVFSSKDEANAQAALVWTSLQANFFWPEAPAEGEEAEEDEQQEVERTTNSKKRSAESRGKSSGRGSKDSEKKRSSAKGKQAAAVDPDSFKTMTTDGRACWKREQRYYVDPWTDDLKNVCRSVLTVEVVKAQLVI